jgi:hypothetical protein
VRRPASNDSRLLIIGIVAFLALVVYLGVAFADTHATTGTTAADGTTAPWIGTNLSNLTPVSLGKGRGYAVRVTPPKQRPLAPGAFGAYVPTLVSEPPDGHRFVVGFSLKGSRVGGPVGVQIHVFRPTTASRYLVNTTVTPKRRWRHFDFTGQIEGTWVGLSINVYRPTNRGRPWFAVRGLTATFPAH